MTSNTAIIRQHGDLTREVWRFSLNIGVGYSCVWFDGFLFQTKESKHHTWKTQSHWGRLMQRDNTIKDRPLLPPDIEAEMRAYYQEYILALPIDGGK